MAKKVDKLAGKNSFLSALRARREAIEGGDPSTAQQAYLDELKIKEAEAKKKAEKNKPTRR